MFKKLSKTESYWGEVVDTADPLKAGRIKVRVFTVFDDLSVDQIPWAESTQDIIEHDLPALGETVLISFRNNLAYMPTWYRKRSTYNGRVSQDDYELSSIVLEKNLERYSSDGYVRVSYTESEGLVNELTKGGNTSTVIIRPDGTIFISSEKSKQAIHIAEDNISIGRESKSQQPAVVGNDNMEALIKLNDMILNLAEMIESWTSKLATICGVISILKPLKPLFDGFGKEVKSVTKSTHSSNNNFFPETKSTVVTVDKTKPE